MIRITDKLAANADHFVNEAQRLAYVKSRCSGRAAEHIIARCREGAVEPYQTVKDLTNHLALIYLNVNRSREAKQKFRSLYIKKNQKFQDFLSEFTYLAQESNFSKEEWKDELYHRLYSKLQIIMVDQANDTEVGF